MRTRSALSSRRASRSIPGYSGEAMKIAVLPGDGIGPEIVAQAVRVLQRLGLPLELQEAPVGGAGYEATGDPLPEATLRLARDADAILFGAIGGPQYDALQ